jgi:tetratricopeptide (TPR) repeat protein
MDAKNPTQDPTSEEPRDRFDPAQAQLYEEQAKRLVREGEAWFRVEQAYSNAITYGSTKSILDLADYLYKFGQTQQAFRRYKMATQIYPLRVEGLRGMAKCFLGGKGREEDLLEAYICYKEAVKAGHKKSQVDCDYIRSLITNKDAHLINAMLAIERLEETQGTLLKTIAEMKEDLDALKGSTASPGTGAKK